MDVYLESAKVDIVIISYNSRKLTENCINSLINGNESLIKKIILVDNASQDDTVSVIKKKYPSIELILNSENLGYAKAVNIGIKYTNTEIVIISNSDIIYPPGSVQSMVQYINKSLEIGCIAPQQIYPNGAWQRSYGFYPGLKHALMDLLFLTSFNNLFKKMFWKILPIDRNPKYVEYLDGACLFIRKEAFAQLNGFDEDYFFYTEEADFCYRLNRSQWQVVFYPKVKIIHNRGGSSQSNHSDFIKMLIESKILFCKKHYTNFHTKLFIKIESYHSIIMKFLWRFISLFSSGNTKIKAQKKINFFNTCLTVWRENEKI